MATRNSPQGPACLVTRERVTTYSASPHISACRDKHSVNGHLGRKTVVPGFGKEEFTMEKAVKERN